MLVGDGSHPLDRQFRVGSPFGIPLYFHIILLGFAAFWILTSLVPFNLPRILWPFILTFSVYLHELGHALTSGYFGARPHRIVLHLFGGVAYVPPGLSPKQDLWVIANGPLVSLALAGIGYGLTFVLKGIPLLYALAWTLFFLNTILFVFNVLPIYPLDGGQFFRQWLQSRYGNSEGLRRSLPLSMATLITMGVLSLVFKWMGLFGLIIAIALLLENHREYQQNRHLFTNGFWTYLWPFGGQKKASQRARDRWPGEHNNTQAPSGGGLSDRIFVWWNRKDAEKLMRKADEEGILNLPAKERALLERYLDAKIGIKEREHSKKDKYIN